MMWNVPAPQLMEGEARLFKLDTAGKPREDEDLGPGDGNPEIAKEREMDKVMFHDKEYSAGYRKLPLEYNEEFLQMTLSYLKEKREQPFDLAVDVGCGAGRSTRELAPYFNKVIGMDISESQINEAHTFKTPENVSYILCPADALKVKDNSVDLITSVWAAHWFEVETFMQEVNRVLKPRGCVAMFAAKAPFEVNFGDCSDELTTLFNETLGFLFQKFEEPALFSICNQYEDIYNAVPFMEKKRITDVMVTYKLSLQDTINYIDAMVMFHSYKKQEPKLAEQLLQNFEKRARDILKESADDAIMDLTYAHFFVMGRK